MRITLFSIAALTSSLSYAALAVDGGYSSLFGGYTYIPGNINNTHLGLLRHASRYGNGFNAGGRLGYQCAPFRYELEYTFLRSQLRNFHINHRRQREVTGYSFANFVMVNAYYDFPDMLPTISPFLGVGVGYGMAQAVLNSTGPHTATWFTVRGNGFAYQGTAGFTYNFSENYALNLAYRYIATDRLNQFGRVFQAHNVSVGAIYRFNVIN